MNTEMISAGARLSRWRLIPWIVALASALGAATPSIAAEAIPKQPGEAFYVRNYAGKCLDYGPSKLGPTVFLNDCAAAHPIQVQEINDRHEVILRAGTAVIGIHNPEVKSLGGTPPPPPTEYSLELQSSNPIFASRANQTFRLDGDSIIWEGILPCLNTAAVQCPPPLPQLVLQIQNARGANGSPLVVSLRHLADSEFWDFNPVDGAPADPTTGFVRVATNAQLWNAVCKTPTVKMLGAAPVIDDPGQADDGLPAFTGPVAGGTNSGCVTPNAGWGSVIVVTGGDPKECVQAETPGGTPPGVDACIDLSNFPPLPLIAGVTLRGNRRGTLFGPQLYFYFLAGRPGATMCSFSSCVLMVQGDYVRVTGLRLRGQSRSTDSSLPATEAIAVGYPGFDSAPLFSITTVTEFIATIDHNDISDWGEAAVGVFTPFDTNNDQVCSVIGTQISYPCSRTVPNTATGGQMPIADDPATLANVHVARNFLHHNEKDSGGYGVAVGRAFIEGNVFLMNRHAITGSGEPHNEYLASYNLVLSNSPLYTGGCFLWICHHYHNQDFDMHGTADPGHWFGGVGGYRADVLGNTFFGGDRPNFELRGWPIVNADFDSNISLQSQGDAVDFKVCPNVCWGSNVAPINTVGNHFNSADPVVALGPPSLGVGDFDHDGADDLFLATGMAWYFSPGGAREWRFLSAKNESVGQVLFGDFDGDGRTDVVTIRNGQIMVSWGGVSDWEVLSPDPTGGRLTLLPGAITAMAVGDFDGDGRADIFWADGNTWWVSYGGNTPFVEVQTSSFHVQDLRFGDFDGNGTTDVFGVVSGNWILSYSPKSVRGLFSEWTRLRSKLTNGVDGMWVADFNGDGIADVAMACGDNSPGCWRISYRGVEDWHTVSLGSTGPYVAGIGHFLGHVEADLLSWHNPDVWISVGGIQPLASYSTQDVH